MTTTLTTTLALTLNTLTRSRRGSPLAALTALALMTGCPPAPSTTDSDSDASSSSSSSSSTGTVPTATVTITTNPTATEPTATEPTTTDPTTSGPTTDPTDPVCEGNEDFTCAGAYECGESCGDLGSRFDAQGCLRPSCGDDDECGADEFCYGGDWGICTGSSFTCADSDGSCECGGTDDCGGNYCVPKSSLSAGEPLIGARLGEACGPDDGNAITLQLGTSECEGDLPEPSMELILWGQSNPIVSGTYPIDEGTSSDSAAFGGGKLTIDSWNGSQVTGSYAVIFGGSLYEGSFDSVEFCKFELMCG